MVVERVEPVLLPYSEETEFSESFTHPDYGYSFNYPENWTLTVFEEGAALTLRNYSSNTDQFYGPGIEFLDPTEILTEIRIEGMSRDDVVQHYLDFAQNEELPPEVVPEVFVSEQTINGLLVTRIDREPVMFSMLGDHEVSYVISFDEESSLVFLTADEDTPFVERLISTLSLP